MGMLLLLILVLLLVGGMPSWRYSRNWGYGPSGLVGVLIALLVVMVLLDVVHWNTF